MAEPGQTPQKERRSQMRPLQGGNSDANLKAYRDRLSHGTENRPEFEYELLTMFARNETSAPFAMPALCFLFYVASMFWATAIESTAWLVVVVGTKFLLVQRCTKLLALPRSEVNVGVWKKKFLRLELVNGLALAMFATIGAFGPAAPPTALTQASPIFVFATLMVILAVRMAFASTLLDVFLVGTVPMTIAVMLRLASTGDFFYFALASMAVGIHLFFAYLASALRSTALAMVEFRAEKDSLFAEVEESRALSDEARRRAEAANKAKSRFLATMSHELRTPLNAIMGFAEVMEHELLGPLGNDTYREYAKNVHSSGNHLLHIINEILDLSRIEAGRYDLHEETVQLADIAADCERFIKIRADGKNQTLVQDFAKDLPLVWADPRALRQICINLLSNAHKFTPQGGRITISVSATDDGGQRLSVRDTGPGIPEDEIPRVLQAFGQGSLAHETAEGGTGLGLPIVKNLIELHGGTFDLKSEIRKGTEVTITLPRQRVMHAVQPLQTPGQERHRAPELPKSMRQPRMKRASPYGSDEPYRPTGTR